MQNQPAAWGAAARAFIYTGSSAPHFLLPIWVALRLQVMALTLSDPMQAEHKAVCLSGRDLVLPREFRAGCEQPSHCASSCPPASGTLAFFALAVSLCRSSQATFPLLLLTALICLLTSLQTLPLHIFSKLSVYLCLCLCA